MEKWTAPSIASLRGDNTIPLQRTFGSLTEYLSLLQDSVTTGASAAQTKHIVKSDNTSTMSAGSPVYTSGANGTNILVKAAIANSEAASASVIGLLETSLAYNAQGYVVTEGIVSGLNTSAASAGDPVWLSPSTAGGLVFGLANKPLAPYHLVYLGVVTRAHAINGEIHVHILNGWELEELHNVSAVSPSTGDTIVYNASTSLWEKGKYPASQLSGSTLSSSVTASSLTTVGTLTSLTLSGTITLANSSNNAIFTSTTADSAMPWSSGPVLQGQTGWSFYSAAAGSYRMGFRGSSNGATRYMWCWDNVLIGSNPSDAQVTSTLNVIGSGRFTSSVTASSFSGSLNAANITNQTGMWISNNRPGPSKLYRRDSDDPFNVQIYWTGSRWRLYGYYGDSGHADTHVGYADSSGTTSGGGMGISYPNATVGGGAPNLIGFRWTNPYVNCTVDNVISAACANFSDRRLKANITDYVGGLGAVKQLRTVTFNPLDVVGFDADTGEPVLGDKDPYDEMIGFVADEIREVIPSAVSGEGTQLQSVNPLQIVAVLVSAIKELDSKVDQLILEKS